MRLYTNFQSLASGATAGIKNKGVLVCNTETVSSSVFLEVINCDNTVAGITLSIGPVTANPTTPLNPNYFLFPFTIKRWTTGGGNMNGFELY